MYKVIDLETTGLSDSSEIAQIAIIDLSDKLNPIGFENRYFNIHGEMPDAAYRVNKLSKSFLEEQSGGKYFTDCSEEIYGKLCGNTLIAHNTSFEKRILSYWYGNSLPGTDWICTMIRYTPTVGAKKIGGHGEYKNCNLRELVSFAISVKGISIEMLNALYSKMTGKAINSDWHDALYDTFVTAFAFHVLG